MKEKTSQYIQAQRRCSLLRSLFLVLLGLVIIFFVTINLVATFVVQVPMPAVGSSFFDVAIVLGYPAQTDGQPSPMLAQRVKKGVELFQQQSAKALIMTGGAAHNSYVEAEVMADLAMQMGVLWSAIVQEVKAQNTYQNLLNSVAMMQAKGWQSAIVVTSPNHLKRAAYWASQYPIQYAVASSGYPASMSVVEQLVFDQWEKYVLTRLYLFGYNQPRK